jgi:hypothetical protein
MVPVKREDKNKSVSVYHLPVSIQHRLFNEKRKTIQLSDREVNMSSDRGYVRHGSGLLIRMVSSVENPTIPHLRFSLFGLILKITHRWRTK